MTDTGKPSGTAGPPWSVDLLADLHAGVLDEEEAAQLWPRVQDDAEAMAVLGALDATQADLSALADAPAPPIPADVAARIDAALAAEAAPVVEPEPEQRIAPVVDLAAARRRRNRIAAWGTGVLGAAAAAVAVVAIVSNAGGTTDGAAVAGDATPPGQTQSEGAAPPSAGEFEVSAENPGSAFGDIKGVKDYGGLQTRDGLEACLQAHKIPTTGQTAGIRPGTVDGKDAVIAVLTTGKLATYRIVAVEPTCSTDNPDELLIDKRFGLNAGG